jgi:hypothetical protein
MTQQTTIEGNKIAEFIGLKYRNDLDLNGWCEGDKLIHEVLSHKVTHRRKHKKSK